MAESETNNLPGLEATMLRWAREAGDIASSHYRRTGELRFKEGRQAVTEADLEIEKMLRRRIGAEFPADGIVGEELGSDFQGTGPVGSSGRTWHLDPVDGTLNFALGLPGFCTSIGLMKGHEVLAGCIYQPLLDDAFTATSGGGARLNGRSISVSARSRLVDAVVGTQLKKKGRFVQNPELLQALFLETMKIRKVGAIALELARVASGSYDALVGSFTEAIHLHDVAAGLLLIREAGGRATDHLGNEYQLGGPDLVATNGLIHDELIALIKRYSAD
ncbi:MAG: inositol monophosphatase [Candidatus Krumholzibacteria bacterium]|nr:inositol monophosphatase [Candidatus Krumholzibacteria bacterium]